MALDIIGTGFGRTGTASLKQALELLGFGPCHHMEEVLHDPPQVARWQAVANGTSPGWDAVFAGYRSQTDWPGAHWWRELVAAYPNAKVLHSVRAPDAWWRSFSDTILTMIAGYRQAPLPPHIRAMMEVADEAILWPTFHERPVTRETAIAAMEQRTADVRATVPAERLLVFDVKDGWEPLCRFLGVPVPEAPFPRANSTEDFWRAVRGGGG